MILQENNACVENKNKNKEDKIENWCTTTENYLIQLGMKDKWDKGTIEALGTKNEWRLAIKTAIQEQQENEWKEEINKKTMLQSWYGKIKNKLEREEYLNIKDPYARVLTTKLRTGSHELRINTERSKKDKVEREERICIICDQELKTKKVEDELHFLKDCKEYQVERKIWMEEVKTTMNREPQKTIYNINNINIEEILNQVKV